MTKKLVRQVLAAIAVLAVLSAAGIGLWFWRVMAASLPALEGEARLPGLSAKVTVVRDRAGVPTVTAANRLDLARALGFLHGQERFFQMDTLRRSGAGELSELVGPAALDADVGRRVHRFRARARAVLAQMPAEHRALIAAYAEGVNAGLAALAHKPFEYSILRTGPAPWLPEDTLLVIYAMYFELQDSKGWTQRRRGLADRALGPALASFLYPDGEPSDAALDGSTLPAPPMPDGVAAAPAAAVPAPPPPPPNGSNAFAISSMRSKDGRAIAANDMHLPLRLPNIWYRAWLQIRHEGAPNLDLIGVTLPGLPTLVAGSNGKLAWGFTNSLIATGDAVRLEPVSGDPAAYMTPEGPRRLAKIKERICPLREPCREVEIEETIWGPVTARDTGGTRYAWRWTAHDTNAIDFSGFRAFETAGTLREAFDAAHKAGLPQQNLVVADRDGQIGWTIIGQVPRRIGLGIASASWADGTRGWRGYLSPGEIPEIVNPPEGILWTANNRIIGGAAFDLLGDGGYASAARARRIVLDLKEKPAFAEADLLAIQLEIRASELDPWQELLKTLLAARKDGAERGMLPYVENWGGMAEPGSVGYRLVHTFQEEAIALIYGGFGTEIEALAGKDKGSVTARRAQWPALRLLTARPAHLVPPPFRSWSEVDDALCARLARRAGKEAGGDPGRFTWGRRNHEGIHHPIALVLPALGWLTDPPDEELPGSTLLPRAAAPGYGSSERFVVSPGHESDGIFEMPGGEASNPLSPYYLAGHEDWVKGRPSPFLPGPPRWTLALTPVF